MTQKEYDNLVNLIRKEIREEFDRRDQEQAQKAKAPAKRSSGKAAA